jgi:MFS family permease
MLRAERSLFVGICFTLWVYVILRAMLVPWVHDESTSLYWFLERECFLPYVALWDAGNHFLSSAIGVLGHKLWGLSLFGSRAGSVLAFPLFAWAAFRIGSLLNDRLVRWCCWSALLFCPFLLDFFSLFRGYGLGMAFFLVAVDGAIRYHTGRQTRDMVQALLGFALADFAVLSLVPLWALVVALLAVDLFAQWRNTRIIELQKVLLWIVLGVLPLLFGLMLSWEMRRRGLLYHGSLNGFVPVTLASLSKFVLGSVLPIVLLGAGASVVGATVALFLRSTWRGPLLVVAALLWADVCMRIAMALLLGVNYPEDRAALHMVPLAILVIAFAVDALAARIQVLRFVALLLLVLPMRSLITANLDHTLLWPEQSVPLRFLEHIVQEEGGERRLAIGAYHQLSVALPYAARINGLSLNPPDVQGFPHTPTDYRIVDERFLDDALPGYRTVDHAPGPRLYLLKRETPLELQELVRHNFDFPADTSEFMEVWRNDTSTITQDLFFEVQAALDSDASFLDLHLVMEQKKGEEALHYHTTRLAALSPKWKNGRLHVMVRMPAVPEANSRVLYFWNPDREPCSVSQGTVRILSEARQVE